MPHPQKVSCRSSSCSESTRGPASIKYSTHVLSALCLSATTTAYVIDTTSCNLVAQAFLAEKLTCAFDMATNVVTELRGPIRQEVQTLMDYLWAPTADPSFYPTPQEAILCELCLGHDEIQF